MIYRTICIAIALAVVLVFTVQDSTAGVMTFFGEDTAAGGSLPVPNSAAAQSDFLSKLSGVTVQDFEGLTPGTTFPINVTFGADTATLNGTSIIGNTGIASSGIGGRFAVSGSQYLNLGTSDAPSFKLTISSPQAAFGFFATDIGDVSGQLALSFDAGPDVLVPHTLNSPSGSGLFFGYIDVDNPFTVIEFKNTVGTSDAFGFDDFTIGRVDQVAVVPLPSAASGVAVLMGLVIFLRRRRSRLVAAE